jgi:hypothetical protein
VLWYNQNGDPPKEIFTKFGFQQDVNLKKEKRILVYSWLPIGTYNKMEFKKIVSLSHFWKQKKTES